MMTVLTPSKHQYGLSIGLMLSSNLFLAVGILLAKWLAGTMPLPLLIFLRFLIPAALIWWVCLITQTVNFKITNIKLHLLRAGFAVLCQYALFSYLRYGSVLNAALLYMTAPLFMPLISKVIDGVSIKFYQKVSLMIGFIGVVFVLKPDVGLLNGAALLGLAAGFFNACTQVTFHKLSHKTSIHHISLSMFTLSSLIALVPLLLLWHKFHGHLILGSLQPHQFMLLLGIAFAAISNQAFKGRAYAKVNKATSLAPFLYAVLLFSALLDWLVFSQTPDLSACLGGVLIVSGGLIMFLARSRSKIHFLFKEKCT